MSEWQPIETGPKDGTLVDLWKSTGSRLTDVRWVVEAKTHPHVQDGWKTKRHDRFTILVEDQFSHWKPLPDPPK